jgi:UDP-3-O-[3-hydroxymyristoyl] glucosamine N-acyltransferase
MGPSAYICPIQTNNMKFPAPVPLTEIAALIGARLIGNPEANASGINEIHKVEEGDLVFVDHPKYYEACLNSAASFIIINKEMEIPKGKALLVVDQPFEAYLDIIRRFRPFVPAEGMQSASAQVGEGTYIAPGAFIGHHVTIGKNCRILPHVTIMDHCVIGDHVIIQSGAVIGSDAFYYNTKKDRDIWYRKMDSCGRVVIEDHVEIGASCTIDRGVTNDTVIGAGSKLDNMVHIGHDTVLGKNCLIAAQVGIAGAVDIEDNVILWGQVGVNKTIRIRKGAVVMGQSGVVGTLEGDKVYWGTPAEDFNGKRRERVWIKRIPEIWEKVRKL